mmetsp:Transcript_101798/g.265503  ORF Transcript_101798/g.265503 Transcript_101798/m.265503 type:complete len:203 (-) Transcript_101798:127-735(-)
MKGPEQVIQCRSTLGATRRGPRGHQAALLNATFRGATSWSPASTRPQSTEGSCPRSFCAGCRSGRAFAASSGTCHWPRGPPGACRTQSAGGERSPVRTAPLSCCSTPGSSRGPGCVRPTPGPACPRPWTNRSRSGRTCSRSSRSCTAMLTPDLRSSQTRSPRSTGCPCRWGGRRNRTCLRAPSCSTPPSACSWCTSSGCCGS